MKVYIKVSNVDTAFELELLLKKLRATRESIWCTVTEDFIVEVNSKMKV